MITIEQLRAASHEDLCGYIADLHVTFERLVEQNQGLLELLQRCRTTIELLQAGSEDQEPRALH